MKPFYKCKDNHLYFWLSQQNHTKCILQVYMDYHN